MFGEKCLKTKMKSYNNKITTNFHNKVPKNERGVECVYLSAIAIDSVLKSVRNFHSQIFLEECKYKIKEKAIKSFIKEDLGSSSNDESEEEAFEKNCEYF